MQQRDARGSVLVTGSGGYIGGHLAAHLAGRGYAVAALQRSAADAVPDAMPDAVPGVTRHAWRLGEAPDPALLGGATALVHCAFQPHRPGADSDAVNVAGTRVLIDACRAAGVKMVFLSTLSAHTEARSHYGRHKLELEGLFDPGRDLVLKLGLVIGQGGLFGNLARTVERVRVVPLFDGGTQPLQCVAMDDLLEILTRGLAPEVTGLYHVGEPEPTTFERFYRELARQLDVRCLFPKLPSGPVLPLLRGAEKVGVPLPVTSENLLGLRHMRAFETAPDLRALGVTLKDYRAAMAAVLEPSTARPASEPAKT